MAIYLARGIRLDGLPEYEREKALIGREVRAIVDKVLEMGDGDAAVGAVRAFAAGVLDVPWSPNRHVKSRVMPARDADGYLRIFDPAGLPLPRDVMEVHEAGLRARAANERVSFDRDLAVRSVYEIAEPLGRIDARIDPRVSGRRRRDARDRHRALRRPGSPRSARGRRARAGRG